MDQALLEEIIKIRKELRNTLIDTNGSPENVEQLVLAYYVAKLTERLETSLAAM